MEYHKIAAQAHISELRESLMRRLVSELRSRKWSQKQAAEYLGVSQPRISNIYRAQTSKFTVDTLVEMLFRLDVSVQLQVGASEYKRSRSFAPPENGSAQEVLGFYNELLAEQPKNVAARRQRALLLWRLSEYENSLADYAICIQQEPEIPGPRFNRIGVLLSAERFQEALEECQALNHLFPNQVTYGLRARALEGLGHFEQALEHHNQEVLCNPTRPGPLINRAAFLRSQGRFQEALDDYQAALEKDPTYSQAREAIEELRTT